MSDPKEKRPSIVDLSPDALSVAARAEAVVKSRSPFDQTAVTRLAGLVGDDEDAAKIRIYLNHELQTYVLINRSDVVHREHVKNSGGLDVSILFVKKDAVAVVREISSQKIQADALYEALRAAESGNFPSVANLNEVGTTTIVTLLFCTNITCSCTSRHSLLCSLFCTENIICPTPLTQAGWCRTAICRAG